MSITQGYKKLTLSVTPNHMAALKRGAVMRIDECHSMVTALEQTGSGMTEIASFWRGQLHRAGEVQMMLSRAELDDYPEGALILEEIERANVIVALEDRADELKKEVAENVAIGWDETAAKRQADLDAVRALLKRMGVSE